MSDDQDENTGVFVQLLANARRDPEEIHDLYLPGDDDGENEYNKDDGESEQATPTGASSESKKDVEKEAGSPELALESAGTKEDDEEYFKQKRKEGKNEDGPEAGDDNSGGHFNEKPSKKPYFIQDGQKLDLKVRMFIKTSTEICWLTLNVAKSSFPQVRPNATDWTRNIGPRS